MASNEVSKNLFDSMAIVMNAKIQKFQYDKTIEARVVSTKYKADGIYKVEFEDAIFDAYSNDNSRYYEGDTVYVHVPKGDFSLQKHIVGRKVDIEKEPERTFTFKMPFDDFLSLEDLTYQDEKATQVHSYIANHPLHGVDNDSNDYNNEIIEVNAKLQELRATYQKVIKLINEYQTDLSKYITPVSDLYTISDQYPVHSKKSYLNIVQELLAKDFDDIIELSQAVEQAKQQILAGMQSYGVNNKYLNHNEYEQILAMIGTDTVTVLDRYPEFLATLNEASHEYQQNLREELSSAEFLEQQSAILANTELTEDEKQQAIEELYTGNRQDNIDLIVNDTASITDTDLIFDNTNNLVYPSHYTELIESQHLNTDGNIGAKHRLIIKITNQYINAKKELQQTLSNYMLLRADQEGAKESNINWLYTWINDNDEPCLFDQLGVAADFQTLLGDYRPRRGTYGLKLIVRGMTKPTENLASVEHTDTLYFLNTIDFYGNTYAFYNYYTQQKLFDVSNFSKLTRIDVYFWQDHRPGYEFKDELMQDIPWQIYNQECPPNIMVTNVKLLMGVDANSFATDKVFLYTYDNLTYGINPYINSDRAVEDKRTLQFAWVHKLEDGTAQLINSSKELKDYNANIYWYQYEYGVAQDTSQYAWRQGGINWKWLQDQHSEDNLYDKFSIDVFPDITKAQEKYRVVLEYNNIPIRSDQLIFTNIDDTIETHVDDIVNEVIFRFLREDENGNLVEDDDIGVFNVYNESNLCIKDENNISYAAKWYYVQIWIRNNDTGEYTPLAIEDEDSTIEVIWGTDELANQSMINQFVAPDVTDLSTAVLLPTSPSYTDKINQNIINITRKFNIRNRLDMRYTHNNITAVVKRNGREYRLQKTLYFGQSGSMGSEYSITLHQLTPRGNCMVDNEPFSIYATVADKFGNKVESQAYHFTWELLSPTIITIGKNDPTWGLTWQNSVWTTGQEGNYADNKITGVIRNGMPLIIRVGVTNAADYPIYQTTAFRLVDKSGFNNLYNISVPDRVEFRSDGKAPIAITAPFYVSDIQNAQDDVIKEYYPQWKLRQWYKPTYRKDWNELVDNDGNPAPDFFSLNEKVVAKREVASNQNPLLWTLFTDENHTIPDYDSDISTESFDGAEQVRYNYLITYIESAYNQAVITYQSSDQTEQDTAIYTEEKEKYENYLDKLNLAASKLVPSHTTYALNPYMNNKANNSVAWYWDDALAENYYTIIEFQNDKDLPYYVRQAIAMTRNEYSSSLVNSWDGSLLVDKENNAFLSKMVSAGSKDQNNRFTGVMMGDWTDNADSSMQNVGLYGFSKGVQVFGLKTDGTGFIGKSGKGQIQFDGNYSLISNYDKSCYINLDPIKLTNENVFDTRTTMGYSPYFLYAKIPKKSTATVQGEGDLLESTYWVRNFMQDASNDYFIVDPNNGILTTGGIIARYGKIGNWLISSSGLYQRHTKKDEYGNSRNNGGHLVTDKFMYLGYPDRDLELEASIRDKYSGVINKINERKQREIEYEQTDITNKVVQLLGEKYAKQIFVYDPIHYFNNGWATLEVINYLENCLEEFNDKYVGQNVNDLLLSIIYDINNLRKIITKQNEDRNRHSHYKYNPNTGEYEDDGNQNYQTGGYFVYAPLLGVVTGIRSYDENGILLGCNFTSVQCASYHQFSSDKSISFAGTKYYIDDKEKYPSWWENSRAWSTFESGSNDLPKVITLSKFLTNLTVEDLRKYINILYNIYLYYLDGYKDMLQRMIEAGVASLTGEELQEFLQQKQELESLYETTVINKINEKYDEQLKEVEQQIQNDILKADNGDNNRFAIYCGEDDIMHSELYEDPQWKDQFDNPIQRPLNAFFTVDWTGTMTARKGILGFNFPWVIDDNGLTQKNNNGIIYLGAPKEAISKDSNKRSIAQKGEHGNSDAVYNQFIFFAGPYQRYIKAQTEGTDIIEYEDRYAETPSEAYYCIMSDGTMFSRRGKIGGWQITDYNLASYDQGNGRVRLNSEYGQIILGERQYTENGVLEYVGSKDNSSNFSILLDGNTGRIVLKHQKNIVSVDSSGNESITYDTFGELWIANYILGSSSNKQISYNSIISQAENLTNLDTQYVSGGSGSGSSAYGYSYSYSVGSQTIQYTPANVTNQGKLVSGNETYTLSKNNDLFVLKTNQGDAADTGIYVTIGPLVTNTVDTTQIELQRSTYIYNDNTQQHNDNFYLSSDDMNSYYSNGQLVSEEDTELLDVIRSGSSDLYAVYSCIKTVKYDSNALNITIKAKEQKKYKYIIKETVNLLNNDNKDSDIHNARTRMQNLQNIIELEWNNVFYLVQNLNQIVEQVFSNFLELQYKYVQSGGANNWQSVIAANNVKQLLSDSSIKNWQVISYVNEDLNTRHSWDEIILEKNVARQVQQEVLSATKDMIIVYPDNGKTITKTVIGVLGTTDKRWDILANNIAANSISVNSGVVAAFRMFEDGERVATIPYVTGHLKKIWDAISALQNASGEQADELGKLGKNLDKKAVAGGTIIGMYSNGSWTPRLWLYNINKGVILDSTAAFACASSVHGHEITLSLNGNVLTAKLSATVQASGSESSATFHMTAGGVVNVGDKSVTAQAFLNGTLQHDIRVDCKSIYEAGYKAGYSDGYSDGYSEGSALADHWYNMWYAATHGGGGGSDDDDD